ncbi:hypothetical protein HBI56_032710 [Parastagonospora nodorum]|nr:hypothetical protein HBH49_014960 [Parastagonospora nodorum]KAH4098783.1 hypothetical protein HBH46_155100 [Parastagonospora nodorum]KAH4176995.1 hypothetical protein HBH43_046470 [Parastagonospora nodorum]KAH4205613.1 hypothetical protein HBI95_129090 [Parastagonospora nodorum]KAH4973529.1 hypothetical protein HBI78_003110 [Parastagonospora nodorum]
MCTGIVCACCNDVMRKKPVEFRVAVYIDGTLRSYQAAENTGYIWVVALTFGRLVVWFSAYIEDLGRCMNEWSGQAIGP